MEKGKKCIAVHADQNTRTDRHRQESRHVRPTLAVGTLHLQRDPVSATIPRNMEAFTPAYVQQILDRFGMGLVVEHFDDSTFTSADAARAIGCELGQIAKSMCLMVAGNPVLVVASGDRQIADAKIARLFQAGRKKVKIAAAEQCVEIFGYPPGGVAPVGHRTAGIPVLIDETLERWPEIHAAAGTPHDNFTLSFEQLKAITGGRVVDCVRNTG